MNAENLLSTPANEKKKMLREHYRGILSSISLERRREAQKNLLALLYPKLEKFRCVVSFASLPVEISVWALNKRLIQEKRIALPRVEDQKLIIYGINDEKCTLKANSYGIFEPVPETCPKISLENIDCVLLPGLCFDRSLQRLGKGKGYYDRFLHSLKKEGLYPHTIGIAFKEQLYPGQLPIEAHDQAVDELLIG